MDRRIWIVVLLTASSCAWTAQKAQLKPQVSVQSANLGDGTGVYVHTVDERDSDVLGNRGAGTVGAQISASSADVVSVVDQSLTSGLRNLGFAALPQATTGAPELRVEVRALHYKVSQGLWAGALDVDAALKAICIHGSERGHEQLHRGHYEDSIQVVQGASNNDEYINKALSTAIDEVLHDRPLMDCLASRSKTPSAGSAAAQR
jgi:hypothetical protein